MNRKEATAGVKREHGYLYFVDKAGDVSRAKMARGRTKGARGPPEKIAKCGVKKDKTRMYFVDKQGDISSAPLKRRLPKLE